MLLDHSWTDEEYRNMEQMYLARVAEVERITAMLDEISAHVGEVGSPSIVLNGMAQVNSFFPSSFFYDREGCAGMVFVATVFEHRPIAQRFEQCREMLRAIAERHYNHVPGDSDPAFEIIRHLNNNWWGRKPTVSKAYPNAFADALLELYPASAQDAPAILVHKGKVYAKVEFRQRADDEAVILKNAAYVEDGDWEIVANEQPFQISNLVTQPSHVKGTDGAWHLVQFLPAKGW